jgi:hypothetical protein
MTNEMTTPIRTRGLQGCFIAFFLSWPLLASSWRAPPLERAGH